MSFRTERYKALSKLFEVLVLLGVKKHIINHAHVENFQRAMRTPYV